MILLTPPLPLPYMGGELMAPLYSNMYNEQ